VSTTSSPLRVGPRAAAKYLRIFAYYCGGPLRTVGVRGPLAAAWGISQLSWDEWVQLLAGRSRDGARRLVQVGYRVLKEKVRDPRTGRMELVDRRDPVTGKRLIEPAHTGLIDVVYAAPKEVAALLVRVRKNRPLHTAIMGAFVQAVLEAHGSLEDHAEVCRVSVQTPKQAGERVCKRGPRRGQPSRQQGSTTRRRISKLLSLNPVVHHTARPTEESLARGAPDPHLHAHVPIICVAGVEDSRRPDGLRYLTPDDAGVKDQAAERDAVFLGALARRLQDLGIPVRFHEDRAGHITWTIDDSDPALCQFFSSNSRRAQALRREHEEATGRPLSQPELQARMRATRLPKSAHAKRMDADPDWDTWADIARRAGFEVPPFEPSLAPIERAPLAEREATLRARLLGPTGLERDGPTFSRAAIRPAVARWAVDLGLSWDHLEAVAETIVEELEVVRAHPDPHHERLRVSREPAHRQASTVEGLHLDAETVAGIDLPPIDIPPLEVAPLDEEALLAATTPLPPAHSSLPRRGQRGMERRRQVGSGRGIGRELER
jgi:hypothetical protein